MNSEHITLRPITRNDYPLIEDIIRRTWKYDALSSNPKDAEHMARLYLRSCLRRATFSCVADVDGKALGIILAGSKKSVPKFAIRRTLSQLWSIALLFTTKTGRGIGKFFSIFDQADEELLKNAGNAFDAEICFFAVDESTRGTGVGKMLFNQALDYLKHEEAKTLYLFTDSSCTYQFYEKRGMRRMGEKAVEFSPHTDYRLNMFIYGLVLQEAG